MTSMVLKGFSDSILRTWSGKGPSQGEATQLVSGQQSGSSYRAVTSEILVHLLLCRVWSRRVAQMLL